MFAEEKKLPTHSVASVLSVLILAWENTKFESKVHN